MNIEIANRLVDLRKKSGLSQEELATKLGLSRQAVSKWERAEASPDTDNLICLAKLYGVSLDDLLNTDESIDDIVKEQVKPEAEEEGASEAKEEGSAEENDGDMKEDSSKKTEYFHMGADGIHFHDEEDDVDIDSKHGIHVDSKDGTHVHIDSSGIHVHDKSGVDHDYGPNYKADFVYGGDKRSHHYKVARALTGSVTGLLAVIAYLLCGFLIPNHYVGWGICWLVFFLVPLASSLVEALYHHKICNFAFPVLVTGVYVLLGMLYGWWHPEWVMFLAIPVYYSIFGPLDKLIQEHDFKKGLNHIKVHVKGEGKDDDDDDDVIDIDAK